MFARLLALLCLGIFLCAQPSFALSDKNYNSFMSSSPEFKALDNKLNQTWKMVYSELTGDVKKSLLKNQQEWIKSGWDKEAMEIWQTDGGTLDQAYAKAAERRINVLRLAHENNQLAPEDAGSVKADDFSNNTIDTDYSQEEQKELAAERKKNMAKIHQEESQADDEPEIPDNCGFVKGWVEVQPGINRLTFEDGHGNIGFYFQNFKHRENEVNCGEIKGLMCFDILGQQAVRVSKKRGQIWTFIGNCRAAD